MNALRTFFRKPDPIEPLTRAQDIDRVYRRNRRSVLLSITIGYALMYTTRLPLAVIKKPLIDGGFFSPEQLGTIGQWLFYGYALGKFVNGVLADHANLKRFFAFGILGSALVNFAMGSSATVWLWALLWGLNGWFQGFGAPSGAVSLSNWFGQKERGFYYGIWSTAHSLGEGLTFVGTSAIVGWLGWRYGFFGPAILCVITAVVVYFSMKDRPESVGLPPVAQWKGEEPKRTALATDSQTSDAPSTRTLQIDVLKTPAIWILGCALAAMAITRYAINSWGILYLQEARGYSLIQAGGILGLNTVAGVFGRGVYGLISDRLFAGRRPPVTLMFGVVEVFALCVIFLTPPGNPVLLTAAFAVYGFTLSGLLATLGGLFAIDIVSRKAAGAAMGMMGIFGYLAAGAQERISGTLIQRGMVMVDGVRIYDFTDATRFWVGASVVSLVLAALLWRVRVKD